MVPVHEIWEEAEKIIGNDDERWVFKRITDAVELLAIKGEFDPTFGMLDICACDRMVTLPREVDNLLAVNICGHPAVGRHALFRFHLNTDGDRANREHFRVGDIAWEWVDMGSACVYRELTSPSKLIGYCANEADNGKNIWVYGEDSDGNTLRYSLPDGSWVNGYPVQVNVNFAALPADAPTISRITRIRKDLTTGAVRLSTLDDEGVDGQLLGVYQWDETEPMLRRIRLSQPATWVRIAFRKKTFKVRCKDDLLPVSEPQAVIMMLRAIRAYDKEDIATGEACESTAVRWLTEKERASTSENVFPMQVHDATTRICDPYDYVD